jgi:hypothetical protein
LFNNTSFLFNIYNVYLKIINTFVLSIKNKKMFKKFTVTDILLFISAMLSLIFSEILYFQGNKEDGTFIGLWVPSILAFGIYLKLINKTKDD